MHYKKSKSSILFVHPHMAPFVKNDLDILKKHYNVKAVYWRRKRNLLDILKNILTVDLTFSWFAGDYSAFTVFLSKLLGKKSIIVAGGYDIACEKEINYGLFCSSKWFRIFLTKYALKNADLVLAVSEHAKKESSNRVISKDVKLLYNGIKIKKRKKLQKEKIVVTIGQVKPKKSIVKGLDAFAMSSVFFPDYKFVIIGDTNPLIVKKLKEINSNLVFTGRISNDEVLRWLDRAKVYCQLSYVESFGFGLAEAMSCGCVPVVTDRGALSEVVGRLGFYVKYDDVDSTVKGIKKAIKCSADRNNKVRNRVADHFSLKKREENLVKILEVLT